MTGILLHIFKTLACSAVILALYCILLQKGTYFRAMRIYLVTGALLSVSVPFIEIPLPVSSDYTQRVHVIQMEETDILDQESPQKQATGTGGMPWETALLWIYAAVASASVISMLKKCASISGMKHCASVTEPAGQGSRRYEIVRSASVPAPFSFLRTIYLPEGISGEEERIILAHESSHIRHMHSEEKLLMSLIERLCWFNPLIRVFGRKLSEVQEFEADRDVLSEGFEVRLYRLTIFKQLFGYYPEISCGLKDSPAKRRFVMMTQTRQKTRMAVLRWSTALILAGAAAFLMSASPYARETPEKTTTDDSSNVITVEVDGNAITLNGNGKLQMPAPEGELMMPKADLVIIRATGSTPMETINDIRQLLRKTGNLRISYELAGTASETVRRYLPPEDKGIPVEILKVRNDDLVSISISSSGDISVSGNIVSPDTGRSPSLTELLTGIISRNHSAMISLAYDMSADFSTYREVLRQIDDAYLAVRNSYALEHFGRPFNDLDDGQMKSVRHEIPMRVSEPYTEAE